MTNSYLYLIKNSIYILTALTGISLVGIGLLILLILIIHNKFNNEKLKKDLSNKEETGVKLKEKEK